MSENLVRLEYPDGSDKLVASCTTYGSALAAARLMMLDDTADRVRVNGMLPIFNHTPSFRGIVRLTGTART